MHETTKCILKKQKNTTYNYKALPMALFIVIASVSSVCKWKKKILIYGIIEYLGCQVVKSPSAGVCPFPS